MHIYVYAHICIYMGIYIYTCDEFVSFASFSCIQTHEPLVPFMCECACAYSVKYTYTHTHTHMHTQT